MLLNYPSENIVDVNFVYLASEEGSDILPKVFFLLKLNIRPISLFFPSIRGMQFSLFNIHIYKSLITSPSKNIYKLGIQG